MLFLDEALLHKRLWTQRLHRVIFKELSSQLVLQVAHRERPRIHRARPRRGLAHGSMLMWRQVEVLALDRCTRRQWHGWVVEDGLKPVWLFPLNLAEHEPGHLLMHLVRNPPRHGL